MFGTRSEDAQDPRDQNASPSRLRDHVVEARPDGRPPFYRAHRWRDRDEDAAAETRLGAHPRGQHAHGLETPEHDDHDFRVENVAIGRPLTDFRDAESPPLERLSIRALVLAAVDDE